MKLPLRHLQINPQGNEFADDHPDYPKDAGQCMRNGHDYDAILDADGEIVADNAGYYPTGIDRDAAVHIVKCVNMHNELVGFASFVAAKYKHSDPDVSQAAQNILDKASEEA